ncbi:MAG: hypothetical protein AAF442_09250 [Pseudomonadota bacterium]
MSDERFKTLAIQLTGITWGWQREFAKLVGVNERTVRRWAKEGAPERILDEARMMIGIYKSAPLESTWIVGRDETGQRFIIHAQRPFFLAKISAEQEPIDGFFFDLPNGGRLYDFHWINYPTSLRSMETLMEQAAKYLARRV